MTFYKCTVPLCHVGTINNSRAASRKVGGKEREVGGPWPPPAKSYCCHNQAKSYLLPVWCTKLRITTDESLVFRSDELRGPRFGFVRLVVLATTTTNLYVVRNA
ncbi:hypothetical protein TNCV_4865481 [Trichonephila clavipes]|nr:hypothetical protein TNCV_4865481 [Trichonephila clavipes]